MKRLLKLKKYVALVCVLILSIFATKKALTVNDNDVNKSERDVVSIMKHSNHWKV